MDSIIMPHGVSRPVKIWLFAITVIVVVLIVFGGFVRLSQSGLSMVEWHIVTGIIPPVGEEAWQDAFEKYRRTPEFKQINTSMTVQAYKTIYLIEFTHRLIARLAGLIVLLPLSLFLVKGIIPRRQSLPYLGIGGLFVLQGLFGWYMVQSGLVDQPHVSPYRLTIHLLTALLILTISLWKGLQHTRLRRASDRLVRGVYLKWLPYGLLGIIILQIVYGGLVAGLKAGTVSNTFPLMFGQWIPSGLFPAQKPWILNLVATEMTVHFVHRWLAFVVLAIAGLTYYILRLKGTSRLMQRTALTILLLVGFQILIGLGVILLSVPISLALFHQATAILVFSGAVFLIYQLHG